MNDSINGIAKIKFVTDFSLEQEKYYKWSSRGQRVSVTCPRFQDKEVTDEGQKSISSLRVGKLFLYRARQKSLGGFVDLRVSATATILCH